MLKSRSGTTVHHQDEGRRQQWHGTGGNGVIEGAEQCDDGNTMGGDGCSANCEQEL
ncbi:MAG: DUF4215 domain-containing protein [Candidatus Binatia bacterium]